MRVVLLVVRWVRNFQVLNCQPRHIIHRNLEVHRDWSDFFPALLSRGLSKRYFSHQRVLVATLKLLNGPLSDLLLWLVLEGLALHSFRQLKGDSSGSSRHGEFDTNLCGEVILRELCPHLHCESQLVARVLVNERVNAERCRILPINAIVHDKEFSIGRVDRHSLHGLEVSCVHALVEVAVIQNHAALLPFRSAHSQIVIQYKAQFRVALEITFHLNDSVDR